MEYIRTMIDYEALEEQYENTPRFEKVGKSQEPVNSHHDLLKRTEHARNRFRKQEMNDDR